MSGETNLSVLLRDMQFLMHDNVFVFCLSDLSFKDAANLNPIMMFHEKTKTSLILPEHEANAHGLEYAGLYKMITLDIHSSLEAIGFFAAITSALAENGISVNPVAAHHHDHLFILQDDAARALNILKDLRATYTTH